MRPLVTGVAALLLLGACGDEEPRLSVLNDIPLEGVERLNALCERLPRQLATREIVFAEPQTTCRWNEDGNSDRQNRINTARREETAEMSLPTGATPCGFQFAAPVQDMVYDDEIFLLYGDVVLASSSDFRSELRAEGGLVRYEWSRIRDTTQKKSQGPQDNYCLGTCSIPATETEGEIRVSLTPDLFRKVVVATALPAPRFTFVTLGDNEDTDCKHSTFRFTVTVSYVVTGDK